MIAAAKSEMIIILFIIFSVILYFQLILSIPVLLVSVECMTVASYSKSYEMQVI